MRIFVISAGMLALAACNFHFSTDEIAVENSIREQMASRGEVLEVDMTQQDGGDHMTGFARIRTGEGRETRLNCTADRQSSGGTFNWRCNQPVDQAMVDEIETSIRNTLQSRGTVLDVQMSRRDDDHMAGFARLRDSNGNEGRMDCTADRQPDNSFNWHCDPPRPANAGGGTAAAAADQGGGKPDGGGDKPTQ
jgi:hypothetical protein